jgi:hypothetical protein
MVILVGQPLSGASPLKVENLLTGFMGPGVSTVPYTITAVLRTVSIQHLAVPYLCCIHKFDSPHRYSTVAATAVYGSRRLYG